MSFELFGIFLYTVFQLLLGFFVFRWIKSEDDYLLAGRRLGGLLVTVSVFATWFGAESCIGTAGNAYAEGLGGIAADPFGYAVCVLVMGVFFAARFWKMGLVTVADLFSRRFGPGAETTTALLMIPTSLLWAAAQIRAFATIVSAASDLPLETAIIVSTLVVVLYTVSGGMFADAVTDLVQGGVLILGLLVLGVVTVGSLGGPEGFVASVMDRIAAEPSVSSSGPQPGLLSALEVWAIPICGSLFAQELVSRVLAARSATVARRSTITAGILYAAVGLIPVALGLAAPRILGSIDQSELVLPSLARSLLPTGMYIIFSGAILSAILSTVDSALLSVSGLSVHNLLIRFRPGVSDRTRLLAERGAVIFGGISAAFLGASADRVYDLVKDASAFGSAGIFVVAVAGTFTRRGGNRAAVATLLAGAGTWVIGHSILVLPYPYLVSLACSVFVFVVSSRFGQPGGCSVHSLQSQNRSGWSAREPG